MTPPNFTETSWGRIWREGKVVSIIATIAAAGAGVGLEVSKGKAAEPHLAIVKAVFGGGVAITAAYMWAIRQQRDEAPAEARRLEDERNSQEGRLSAFEAMLDRALDEGDLIVATETTPPWTKTFTWASALSNLAEESVHDPLGGDFVRLVKKHKDLVEKTKSPPVSMTRILRKQIRKEWSPHLHARDIKPSFEPRAPEAWHVPKT